MAKVTVILIDMLEGSALYDRKVMICQWRDMTIAATLVRNGHYLTGCSDHH